MNTVVAWNDVFHVVGLEPAAAEQLEIVPGCRRWNRLRLPVGVTLRCRAAAKLRRTPLLSSAQSLHFRTISRPAAQTADRTAGLQAAL